MYSQRQPANPPLPSNPANTAALRSVLAVKYRLLHQEPREKGSNRREDLDDTVSTSEFMWFIIRGADVHAVDRLAPASDRLLS